MSWVFAAAFVIGCLLAGLGGALVAPTVSITLGMDHTLIIEAFLIVTIGGLGNMWGALVGSLIFGVTQSLGVLVFPQFAIVFPLHRGGDRAAPAAQGAVEIRLVEEESVLSQKNFAVSGWFYIPCLFSSSFSFCLLSSPGFFVYILGLIYVTSLLAMSLNLLVGHGGMFQFHHAVFYGVGAYTVALILTKTSLAHVGRVYRRARSSPRSWAWGSAGSASA